LRLPKHLKALGDILGEEAFHSMRIRNECLIDGYRSGT